MRFEWDENKRRLNVRKHGLDLYDAKETFSGPMFTQLDTREDYGEDRWIGIGVSKHRIVVIIYTEREANETIRVISMRKALDHERRLYEDYLSDRLG